MRRCYQVVVLAMTVFMLSCGSDLLPTQTTPWIEVKWLDTHAQRLDSGELGILQITSGGYLFGNTVANANFLPDRTNLSNFVPGYLKLDEYGSGETGITIGGIRCTNSASTVLDSMTIRLEIQSVTRATTRLALVCQDGLRPK